MAGYGMRNRHPTPDESVYSGSFEGDHHDEEQQSTCDRWAKILSLVFFSVSFMALMGLNLWAIADRMDADGLSRRSAIESNLEGAEPLFSLLESDSGLSSLYDSKEQLKRTNATDEILQSLKRRRGVETWCSNTELPSSGIWSKDFDINLRKAAPSSRLHALLSSDGYGAEEVSVSGSILAMASRRGSKLWKRGVVCTVYHSKEV